ncbi:MAG: HAMP domain-containing sensor histidine kinase [Candidatus Nitrosocosmicus sp.]
MAKAASDEGRTRVLYGVDSAIAYGKRFMERAKCKMDITFDQNAPSIVIKIPMYYENYKKILKRGGKIRCITVITRENLSYCNELLNIVSELRHLDGLKGGIATNESEYMATTILREAEPLTEVIYSNAVEVVSQGQYIFDALWNNAIPAHKKIKEIEQGTTLEKTDVVVGEGNAIRVIKDFLLKAKDRLEICLDSSGPTAIADVKEYKTGLNQARSNVARIRVMTEVTKDNLSDCKEINDFVDEIRHLDTIKGNFAITESEYISTPMALGLQPVSELIYSNVNGIVEQQQYIFDILWNKAIPFTKKTQEIEEGVEIEFVDVINDPIKSKDILTKNLKSPKNEILLFVPTSMLILLQNEMGLTDMMNRFSNNSAINIRVLLSSKTGTIKSGQDIGRVLSYEGQNNISIRSLEKDNEFKSLERTAIVIIDKRICIIIELNDDYHNFSIKNSLKYLIFSNNKTFVSSYLSVFQSLWRSFDLLKQLKEIDNKVIFQEANLENQIARKTEYLLKINNDLEALNREYVRKDEELKKTNEELLNSNIVKNEFISMISHELRTPLVPIKGYTEMLLNPRLLGELNEKQLKAIKSIYRNVKKQESLVEDILDSTKLDLGQLNLLKKDVIIPDLFSNVIKDLKFMTDEKRVDIIVDIETNMGKNKVYCDERRIEQVLSNLIKNSIDFVPPKEGKIVLHVEKKERQSINPHNKHKRSYYDDVSHFLVFTVKDNGPGIPKDKIGNLFRRFYQIDTSATRSHAGTGLGLVICKGIIEAHGGQIWVDKNHNNGCSISFSIPLIGYNN